MENIKTRNTKIGNEISFSLSHHDILCQREAVAVGDGVDDDAGVRVVGRQGVLNLHIEVESGRITIIPQ